MRETDIVVVGAGLAGLRAAMTAAQSGLRVELLAKDRLCTGSSFYPMMDMVACQSADGTLESDALFLREVLDASQDMASEAMYRTYIEKIPEAVRRMPELGIMPRLTDPKPACFAETARPTYCWSGWPEIRERARALLLAHENVHLWEGAAALAILKKDNAVCGLVVHTRDGIESIACRSIVLATGGFGDLYRHSLNTPDVSGDGQVLALRAGARLINLEFLQFIPGFMSPAYKTVFREPALRYAQRMTDDAGTDLLAAYLPDEADRQECLRLRACHGPFTSRTLAKWFDIAMMREILAHDAERGLRIRYNEDILRADFTFITPYVRWLKEEKHVDIVRDEIRIAPFFHAANGGVHIGSDCQTHVQGLFAAGEVAGGIHGADRQGGTATGSCLVFGDIAGASAVEHARGMDLRVPSATQMQDALREHYGAGKSRLMPSDILDPLRTLLWRNANILRNEQGLENALGIVRDWREGYTAASWLDDGWGMRDAVKADHLLTLAEALLMAMRERRESRGAHFREEYPETDASMAYRLEVKIGEHGAEISKEA